MEIIHLPDKFVADDITTFLLKKTNKHLFSDIYEGRTILNPNCLMQYNSEAIFRGYFSLRRRCGIWKLS